MANKKTNTVKEVENPFVPAQEEVKETVKEEPVVAKSVKSRRKFDQNDGVMCRSVTKGLLNLIGQKTGIPYKWFDYGDRSEVEYRDLVAEVRSHGASVFDPRFIIEDEDFLAEFPQVVDFYNENCNIRDLDAILQMTPDKMREALLQLPKSTYPNIKILAGTLVSNGQLDSIKKIKILDEILGTDLNFLADLLQ